MPAAAQIRRMETDRKSLDRFTGNEPTWLVPGLSLGAGGMYQWVGLSADLHYGPATLRLHPGLWQWGGGLQYYFDPNASTFNPRQRPFFVEASYLRAWWLGKPDEPGFQKRQRLVLLFGKRWPLTRQGDVYLELATGLTMRWDTWLNRPGTLVADPAVPPLQVFIPFRSEGRVTELTYVLPVIEARVGVAMLRKRLLPRHGRGLFTPEPRKKGKKRR